ncbi:MAG: hypothetical protein HYY64_20010 [Candidatus Rokubacteria bacterium]|nr:hypothetical protein [Candidatus Rokubacteria bacterium]
MTSHLFIVAWNRPDLWDYWKRWFAGVENVEVILDRRRGERRQSPQAFEPERRRTERRGQAGVDDELRTAGFAIVTR